MANSVIEIGLSRRLHKTRLILSIPTAFQLQNAMAKSREQAERC